MCAPTHKPHAPALRTGTAKRLPRSVHLSHDLLIARAAVLEERQRFGRESLDLLTRHPHLPRPWTRVLKLLKVVSHKGRIEIPCARAVFAHNQIDELVTR